MASKTYGLDMGTAGFRMCSASRILDERCCVAFENRTKLKAAGDAAYEMYEKAPASIRVSFPVQNGVLAGMADMEQLLAAMYYKINDGKKVNGAEFLVAVPTGITGVQRRAFTDVLMRAGLREHSVQILDMPLAAALGSGIDVLSHEPSMIVQIGAARTEISIIQEGGVLSGTVLDWGGDRLDEKIIESIRAHDNLLIGHKTAENIKKQIGSALPDQANTQLTIFGRNVLSGLPYRCVIDGKDIYQTLGGELKTLLEAVSKTLEKTPPVAASVIREKGFMLSGGMAALRGLREFLSDGTGIPCALSMNPGEAVIRGLIEVLKDPRLSDLAREPEKELL